MLHYSQEWEGCKPGWAFKTGKHGLGYYVDDLALQQQTPVTHALKQQQSFQDCPEGAENASSNIKPSTEQAADIGFDAPHSQLHAVGDAIAIAEQMTEQRTACDADVSMPLDSNKPAAASSAAPGQPLTKAQPDAAGTEDAKQCTAGNAGVSRDQISKTTAAPHNAPIAAKPQLGVVNDGSESSRKGGEESEARSRDERHYWGQALQYLDKSADVVPGAPLDASNCVAATATSARHLSPLY